MTARDERLRLRCMLAVGMLLALGVGCEHTIERTSALELGRRYVESREFRRAALEQSLAVRDNGYARARLGSFATTGGWEELPVWSPLVERVGDVAADFEAIGSEEPRWTHEALLERGRAAFERWPAQRAGPLDSIVRDGELASRLGLERDASGWIGGLLLVRYPDGSQAYALSCATCHSRVEADGSRLHGAASNLDLAAVIAAQGGEDAGWGEGRLDVTADEQNNPVAIPDLRATRHQLRLHWTGNLHNDLPALAVRLETLLIEATSATVRPPRALVFALAYYVWSLGEAEREQQSGADASQELGADLFSRACASCHTSETGAGELVRAERVGTDSAAAQSLERGSPGYRVPSLYRVASRTRLTHEGRYANLEELFDPARAAQHLGHIYGLELTTNERTALLDYLRTF